MPNKNKIQFLRGNKELLPPLATGEPAICLDTKELYVGGKDEIIRIATQEDVTVLNSALSNKANVPQQILSEADLNYYVTPGMFYIGVTGASVQHTPVTASSFSLFVEKTGSYSDTGRKQTFTVYNTGNTYIRVKSNQTTWVPWKPLATAEPPVWRVPQFQNGWGTLNGFNEADQLKFSISGNTATLDGLISAPTTEQMYSYILTLPAGFCPTKQVWIPATTWQGKALQFRLNPGGNLFFWGGEMPLLNEVILISKSFYTL